MATPIKAIPTLYGEEARRFQEMANDVEEKFDPKKKWELNDRQREAYEFLKRQGLIRMKL